MASPLSLFAYLQINWNGKPVSIALSLTGLLGLACIFMQTFFKYL
jgi:hypothetical protein